MANFLAAVGEKERALEVATLVLHHPASWQWSKDSVAPLVAELETELPSEVVRMANARGKDRMLERVVGDMLREAG
jgi:hypothetical protein